MARRYVPKGIGEHSSPVEAGVASHSQDRWESPSMDQQQVGSDRDTDGDREKAPVHCREGLAAASLAACFVKLYKAQNSAHPQFGTEVRGPAGIWVICSKREQEGTAMSVTQHICRSHVLICASSTK